MKNYPDDDAWIEIAYADLGGDGKPNAARHFSPFELDKAANFAETKNKAGFNIYIGPALRRGKTGSNSNGRRQLPGKPLSVGRFRKAGRRPTDQRHPKRKKLLTAMTVVTGTTPNVRAHLYFRIAGQASKDQVREVNVALKTLLGTDDVEDVCRVMRLAGTVSYPPPDKVARGYIPEVVTLHPRKNAPAYTVEQLTGVASPNTASDPFEELANETKPSRTDKEIMALLETSRTAGKWHTPVRDAIASMIGRGWSDSAIRMAWDLRRQRHRRLYQSWSQEVEQARRRSRCARHQGQDRATGAAIAARLRPATQASRQGARCSRGHAR